MQDNQAISHDGTRVRYIICPIEFFVDGYTGFRPARSLTDDWADEDGANTLSFTVLLSAN